MKKILTCVICGYKKGKRMCLISDDLHICPVCCAKIRNNDCKECPYYSMTKKFQASKKVSLNSRPSIQNTFFAEFDDEVDQMVDQSLQLVEQGFIRKAENQLKKLLLTYPHNHMVLYGMGVCKVMQERWDESIEYFDKAIDIYPYLVEAHFNRAGAYKSKKKIRPTIEGFMKVVEIGDRNDPCVIQAKEILDDFAISVRQYDNISVKEYFHAQDLFDKGVAAIERHEWISALDFFAESSKINPNIPQLYGNSALCHAVLGNKEAAIEALKKAFEVDPKYDLARFNRVVIENLKPGECLSPENIHIMDYYGDSD